MGKFNYELAKAITNEIKEMGGTITRPKLAQILIQRTGTMMPWFIKSYMQSMASSGMLLPTEDGFKVVENG